MSKRSIALILILTFVSVFGMGTIAFGEDFPVLEALKGTPKIDGVVDASWAKCKSISPNIWQMGSADKNATCTLKAMWDENNLYILCEAKDALVVARSTTEWYNDSLEMHIDEGFERGTTWDTNDGKFRVEINGNVSFGNKGGGYDNRQITSGIKKTSTGYVMEIVWPWVVLKGKVAVGSEIGFDPTLNDDSDGMGTRTGAVYWTGGLANPSTWGIIRMMPGPVVEATSTKAPTTTGTTSSDKGSTTTTTNTDTTTSNPTTGDNSLLFVFVAAAVASLAGFISLSKRYSFQK